MYTADTGSASAIGSSQVHTPNTSRLIVTSIWIGLTVLWLLPSILLNLYTFGGIDFPSELVQRAYFFGGMTLQYATAVLLPPLALLLEIKRGSSWMTVVALLAIPLLIQVLGIALYVYFSAVYGTVCC